MTSKLSKRVLHLLAAGTAALSVSAYSSPDVHGRQDAGKSPDFTPARTASEAAPQTAAVLGAAELRFIAPNPDGTITAQQYSDGMSRRWDALPKNQQGNLPAAGRIDDHWDDGATRAPRDLG